MKNIPQKSPFQKQSDTFIHENRSKLKPTKLHDYSLMHELELEIEKMKVPNVISSNFEEGEVQYKQIKQTILTLIDEH